ncbi:MAG TPA: Crp/Fnr family transcriptional regulator [Spirochaetota bacterium]|nr:Crp/Fnr family transcriptional regulator [Spirochaetota bacterium]
MDLKERVTAAIPELRDYWPEIKDLFSFRRIPEKTILLEEGDVSKYLYIVSKGCLRLFVIKEDGREVTAQFFFENQMVASMESAFTGKPGRMYLESIEESEVVVIRINDFRKISERFSEMNKFMVNFLQQRLLYYTDLYTSFILNTPEERYEKLLKDNPEMIERVPHHYIASYLGITAVSLSRIRSRIAKKDPR